MAHDLEVIAEDEGVLSVSHSRGSAGPADKRHLILLRHLADGTGHVAHVGHPREDILEHLANFLF